MNAIGLHHIALTVNNWGVSRPFYLGLAEALVLELLSMRKVPHIVRMMVMC